MDYQRLHDTMDEVIQRGDIPGMVTLVAQDDEVHIDALGVMDLATGMPIREDR